MLDESSQEGKIPGGTTRGSEKGGGTAGTMRLLGHKSWVQALLTDGVGHTAAQAHCCLFIQVLTNTDKEDGTQMDLSGLDALQQPGTPCFALLTCELLFCSSAMLGKWMGESSPSPLPGEPP